MWGIVETRSKKKKKQLSTTSPPFQEFKDAFYEGKELADQSEILELPQDANPESYYYGEGGDYEEGEDRRGS